MSKSKRHTLYLTAKSMQIIGPAENRAGRVNGIISHYGRITAEACPALTTGQWSFLADMLNGTFVEDNTGDYLWADIAESGKLDGLAKKWELDADQFAEQVRAMSHAERCALLDVVLRFWKGDHQENLTIAEQLHASGAIIKE